jgi:hypothetical protein
MIPNFLVEPLMVAVIVALLVWAVVYLLGEILFK